MAGEGKVVPEGVRGKDIVAIVAAEADFDIEKQDAHQRSQNHRNDKEYTFVPFKKTVDSGVCSLIGTRLVHLIFVLVYLCLFVLF